jgi:topoisomerase-4 subunit B
VESVRDEKQKAAGFSAGNLMLEEEVIDTKEKERRLLYSDEAILKITNTAMSM